MWTHERCEDRGTPYVGKPRMSNWSGWRTWTQEWCFEPERQSVERYAGCWLVRKDEFDNDPRSKTVFCRNRCRQARLGSSVVGGSSRQRSDDRNSLVWNYRTSAHGNEAMVTGAGCESGAMESTGSYWIPVRNVVERAMEIVLVCGRKHRPRKGEKTDFRDAVDLGHKHRHGLLSGSYLPGASGVGRRAKT